MIGYGGVDEEGVMLAHRIGLATGCRVMADTSGKTPRGQGRPAQPAPEPTTPLARRRAARMAAM